MNRRQFIKLCTLASLSFSTLFKVVYSKTKQLKNIILLRPPFSIKEKDFINECISCGLCAKVCPVNAIKMIAIEKSSNKTPIIIPKEQFCTLCLKCVEICPTKAIKKSKELFKTIKLKDKKVKKLKEFSKIKHCIEKNAKIGNAEIYPRNCLAYLYGGCKICVSVCKFNAIDIKIIDGKKVPVVNDNCIGCGECEFNCPTDTKAIKVKDYYRKPNGLI